MKLDNLTIDTISNKDFFIIIKDDGKEFLKVSKKRNTLNDIKRLVGEINIKQIL